MSAGWSWASLADSNSENSQRYISKVASHLSTCPKTQDNGQVDKSPWPLEDTADDWLEFYSERAGIAEHCGKMSKAQAEKQAFESCISKWIDTHQPAIIPDVCASCGKHAGIVGQNAIITGSGHWLHNKCHSIWLVQRRQEAIKKLRSMGLTE